MCEDLARIVAMVLVAPSGLPSLLAFAKPGQIVFGTDYPYASEPVCKTFTRNLDRHALPPGKLDEINTAPGIVKLVPGLAEADRAA